MYKASVVFSSLVGVAAGMFQETGFLRPATNASEIVPEMVSEVAPKRGLEEGRIVNGVHANLGDLPYQVHIHPNPFLTTLCGGTLISAQHVVTAAHCGIQAGYIVSTGHINILKPGQLQFVLKATNHPEYNPTTKAHDIAVLKLANNVTLDTNTNFIGMATATTAAAVTVTISGWGKTKETNVLVPELLSKVDIATVANTACNTAYEASSTIAAGSNPITADMICAEGNGQNGSPADTCQGDSGGPMVSTAGTVKTLEGVTSWGIGCAQASFPGVYSRVFEHRTWIMQIVNGAGHLAGMSGALLLAMLVAAF